LEIGKLHSQVKVWNVSLYLFVKQKKLARFSSLNVNQKRFARENSITRKNIIIEEENYYGIQ